MKAPSLATYVGLASLAFALSTLTSPAAVIGYWRFENGSTPGLDSSGNGYNLTLDTGGGGATRTVLPGSGAGSHFFDPVPQTDAANTAGLTLATTSSLARAYVNDQPAFAVQDFTIEALVNLSSLSQPAAIAGQAATNAAGQSAWFFRVDTNGVLRLNLSQDGTSFTSITTSQWTLQTGVDYYLAASVDFVNTGVDVTFYYQNLTANGNLESITVHNGGITSLANSSARFTVGAYSFNTNGDNSAVRLFGIVDEVRWSSTALGESSLLAIPESAPVSLALGAGGLFLALRRVRRS